MVALAACAALSVPFAALAATTNEFDSGTITLGARLGGGIVEGYSDWLMPVWRGTSGLLFVNPRFSTDDDAQQEYNLGLGYRHYFARSGVILGFNGYYDHREVSGCGFDQVGAGIELLSRWVDLRANYYYPGDEVETLSSSRTTTSASRNYRLTTTGDPYAEGNTIRQQTTTAFKLVTTTTTCLFEQYGQAMEGFDLEAGGRLPVPVLADYMDIALFAGYYRFNGVLGDDDIEGFKGRLELTALPAVTIDAEFYEDEELYGGDFFIGARVTLPFDPARLARGRNPFAGALEGFTWKKRTAALAARMDTMVLRDLHVRTTASALTEVTAARQTSTSTATKKLTTTTTIMKDITFVDGDNTSGVEDGSIAHPYNTIQEGVDNVTGLKNVFVFDSAGVYQENVVLVDGLSLYGSGCGIVASGGKIFGKGNYPVIDGASKGPSITLADDNVVSGVSVMNTDISSYAPVAATFRGDKIDVSRTGILGLNVDNSTLDGLQVGQCGVGAMFLSENTGGFVLDVNNCTFENNQYAGLVINGVGGAKTLDEVTGDFEVSIRDSHFDNNGSDGLSIRGLAYAGASLDLHDNTAIANGASGVDIDVDAEGDASLRIDSLIASGNTGWNGLFVSLASDAGDARGIFSGITAEDNTGNGIEICDIYTRGGGLALADLSAIEVNRNSAEGLDIDLETVSGPVALNLNDVNAGDNGGDGVYIGYMASESGPVTVSMSSIAASGNGSCGIAAFYLASGGNVAVDCSAITVFKNGNDGMNIYGRSESGNLTVTLDSLVATENANDGVHLSLATGGTDGNIGIGCDDITAGANGDVGLYVAAASAYGAVDAAFDAIIANGNTDHGIYASLEATCVGGDAAARSTFNDIEANDNAGTDASGVHLVQYSYNGASSAVFTDVVASRNRGDNIYAYVEASFDSGSGDAVLTLNRVQADRSIENDGIAAMAYSYGDGGLATVAMTDTSARYNSGYGIDFADAQAFGLDGDASVILTRVTGADNYNDGIWSYVYAPNGQASFTMEECVAINNQGVGRGVYVELYSGAGADQVTVRNSTFTGNSSDGIEIDSGGTTRVLNLGDAAAGTAGNNVFAGNGGFAVHNSGFGTITAENNWWGIATPPAGFFSGAVDYTPWLTAAP